MTSLITKKTNVNAKSLQKLFLSIDAILHLAFTTKAAATPFTKLRYEVQRAITQLDVYLKYTNMHGICKCTSVWRNSFICINIRPLEINKVFGFINAMHFIDLWIFLRFQSNNTVSCLSKIYKYAWYMQMHPLFCLFTFSVS